MRNILIIGFCLLLTGILQAQQGELVLKVAPSDAIVHIDGLKNEQGDSLQLSPGWHRIEVWKAGHEYLRDSVLIQESKQFTYERVIAETEEFQQFQQELRTYQFAKIGMRYAVPAIFLGIMTQQTVAYVRSSRAVQAQFDQANTWAELQQTSVNAEEIRTAQEIYAIEKELYNLQRSSFERRQNTLVTIGIIGGAAALALEYLSFRLDRPDFREVPRLTFQGSDWGNGLALNYTFKR